MIYRYPNNWTICFLNNIIKNFQAGFACGRKNESEGLPHLRMHNIGIEGKLDIDLIRKVPHALAQKHHFLQKGDILFCTTNSAKLVGKSAIFNLDGDYTFSNHLIRLRVIPEDIDPKMLQHFLWLQWKGGVFEEHCKNWVNQSTLPKEKLLSTRIPLPPLTEQHRIVAKLEKLLAKVDKCKERLEKIPAILKRFRQSVLTAACSGQLTEDWRKNNPSSIKIQEVLGKIKKERLDKAKSLTEKKRIEEIYQCQEKGNSNDLPEGWEYILLNKLCESFQYGTSRKSEPSGKIAVLRMGNIQNGQIDWGDLVYTSADEDIAKYRMNKGDVLFNRTNSPELVGKTGIYKGEQPAIFAGYLIRIKSSELLNSKYLNYFLNTPYAHELCLKAKTDGVSQSNINAQKLGNFEIPFCRLEEQIEIVRRINTLLEVAVDIQVRYQRANIFVGKLTQSILAKAFRGELVPQDANDEPASELLKRIQAERDQERGKEPKARKRGKPYRKRNKAVQASDQNPEPDNNETPDHQEASPVQVEKESFAQKAKGKPSEFSIQQPLPLVDLDQQTIMAAFRKACRNHSEISRDDLLKAAALNLGYQRLSSKLKVKLQADMRAAMLRKIVRTNGNMIHPATRNADDYAPDDLVKFACSVTKKGKLYEEDTVIRDTLKHLGFQRITSRMRNTVASAIQVGIRSGVFVRDQGMIFRP